MNENGIYHVFYQTRDETTDPYSRRSFVIFLKSFATEKEAKEWILLNGEDIVEEQEDNFGTPIVIFIVYDTNEGIYDTGYEPTNPHYISSHKYPVYAFSKEGYKMLFDEHIYLLGDDHHSNCDNYNSIPHWINYVTNEELIQGVKKEDIIKISEAYMRVDKETKKKYINDIKSYTENPQKYIEEQLNQK